MKNAYFLFNAVLLCYALTSQRASAEYLFSPDPASANIMGAGIFLVKSSEFTSARGQEVHAASAFAAASGPILLIAGLSYSAPTWSGRVPIDVTLPNIEIRLSTTGKGPDGLSTTFADNIGPDQTTVYSGPLHFFETQTEKYDIHIPISPFRYDPAVGNLLIDIFNYAPIFSRRDPYWTVDQVDRLLDPVSAVGGRAIDPFGFAGTAGTMVRFTYTPVPEPGTWAILAIGLVSFGVAAFKRRRR